LKRYPHREARGGDIRGRFPVSSLSGRLEGKRGGSKG
jgi:hypothetical protein